MDACREVRFLFFDCDYFLAISIGNAWAVIKRGIRAIDLQYCNTIGIAHASAPDSFIQIDLAIRVNQPGCIALFLHADIKTFVVIALVFGGICRFL